MFSRLFVSYTQYLHFSYALSGIAILFWIVAVSCNVTDRLIDMDYAAYAVLALWLFIFLRIYDVREYRVYFLIIGLMACGGEYYLGQNMPSVIAEKQHAEMAISEVSFRNVTTGDIAYVDTTSPFVTKEKVGAEFGISYLYLNDRYIIVRHELDERFYVVGIFALILSFLGWLPIPERWRQKFNNVYRLSYRPRSTALRTAYADHMEWEFYCMLHSLVLFLFMLGVYFFWAEGFVNTLISIYEFYPAHPLFLLCCVFVLVILVGGVFFDLWLKTFLPKLTFGNYFLNWSLSIIFMAGAVLLGIATYLKVFPDAV